MTKINNPKVMRRNGSPISFKRGRIAKLRTQRMMPPTKKRVSHPLATTPSCVAESYGKK